MTDTMSRPSTPGNGVATTSKELKDTLWKAADQSMSTTIAGVALPCWAEASLARSKTEPTLIRRARSAR